MASSGLTLRLTYRRRGSGWSANKVLKCSQAAERKARAAVRCRCVVGLGFHLSFSRNATTGVVEEQARNTELLAWAGPARQTGEYCKPSRTRSRAGRAIPQKRPAEPYCAV